MRRATDQRPRDPGWGVVTTHRRRQPTRLPGGRCLRNSPATALPLLTICSRFSWIERAIYAPTVASDDEYSLIRIFPDYADSVIWFIIGPLSYDESGVSKTLRHDMEAWETHYYETMGSDYSWRSREDQDYHAAEGRRLAECLSVEVGRAFEVEYFDQRDRKLRVSSDRPAANEAAEAAFTRVGAWHRSLIERIEREAEAGASFGWFASYPHDDAE
jgi:hypothetical protein